jgi:hypothetical protein
MSFKVEPQRTSEAHDEEGPAVLGEVPHASDSVEPENSNKE